MSSLGLVLPGQQQQVMLVSIVSRDSITRGFCCVWKYCRGGGYWGSLGGPPVVYLQIFIHKTDQISRALLRVWHLEFPHEFSFFKKNLKKKRSIRILHF